MDLRAKDRVALLFGAASVVAFLPSVQSSSVTGSLIRVDGGRVPSI